MAQITDKGKAHLTRTLEQLLRDRNIDAAMMNIETVFGYELELPARERKPRKEFLNQFNRKKMAEEYTHEEHVKKMLLVFPLPHESIPRIEVLARLKLAYGVGYNLLEKKEGIFSFLKRNAYLQADGDMIRIGEKCNEQEAL